MFFHVVSIYLTKLFMPDELKGFI